MLDEQTTSLIFEYQYRDASNYKVQGALLLTGTLSIEQKIQIADKFDNEFFIAEQIGVPALYDMLYEFSDGSMSDDHVWHEFIGFRQSEQTAIRSDAAFIGAADFFQRVMAVDRWDIELSPHCD